MLSFFRFALVLVLCSVLVGPATGKVSKKGKKKTGTKTSVPSPAPVDREAAAETPGPEAPPAAAGEPAETAAAAPETRRPAGPSVVLPIKARSRVRAVSFYMEGEEQSVVEDQSSAEPNSIVNVGMVRDTVIGFEKEQLKQQGKKFQSRVAVFYVFSGVERLREFEVTPTFLKQGDDLVESGKTPAVFRLEVLELERIGDASGEVLKTMDEIAFTLGEANLFTFDVSIPAGKKVGMRLSIPDGKVGKEELYLQIKASKKGKFPVNIQSADGRGEPKVSYSPQVRWVFVPRAGDMDTFSNPTEGIAAQINRYVERHRGEGPVVEVPLKVRVEYR